MIQMKMVQGCVIIAIAYLISGISACKFSEENNKFPLNKWDSLIVSASAYNSLTYQTGTRNPNITAWGDTLTPKMKVIAVSRDLIKKGLIYNTPVRLDGFEGIYYVKDKMHHRWKNKIDIYMGVDVQKARKWGRKKIKIHYLKKKDSLTENN